MSLPTPCLARRRYRWQGAAALALGLCAVAGPAAAQTQPQAPAQANAPAALDGRRIPETWQDFQQSQSWATARLDASPLRHQWVSIPYGSGAIRAFVTYPAGKARAPVVLVVHEVFGLTDSSRNTADEIARMGYITIAPDMLSGLGPGGGNVESFANGHDASEAATGQTDAEVDARINAVAGWGLKLRRANGRLGYVGLSWGGGAGFRYADFAGHDPRLKLVAVFYDVGPPAVTQGPARHDPNRGTMSVDAIDVPVFGFYGSLDTRVMSSLEATRAAMKAAGKFYDPVVYEGASHAYMRVGEDPANPNAADPPAVAASLKRLRHILARYLVRR